MPRGPPKRVTAGPVSNRFALRESSQKAGRTSQGHRVSEWAVCFHIVSQPLGAGMWVLPTLGILKKAPRSQGPGTMRGVDEALLLLLHDPGLFLRGGSGAVMGTGCYIVTQATY